MAEQEIECQECGWRGPKSDLDSKAGQQEEPAPGFCPECGGTQFTDVTDGSC